MGKIQKFEAFVKRAVVQLIEDTDFVAQYNKRKFSSRDKSPVRHDKKADDHEQSKPKRQGRKKDPNAPKKKKGLYFLWANDPTVREQASKELGGSANRTDVNAYLSKLWAEKKGDAEYFKKWQTIVDEDVKRYDAEFAQYKANGSFTPYVPPVEKPATKASKPAVLKARVPAKKVVDTSESDDSSE